MKKKCDIRIVVYNANYSVGRHVLQIVRNLYVNYAQSRKKQ